MKVGIKGIHHSARVPSTPAVKEAKRVALSPGGCGPVQCQGSFTVGSNQQNGRSDASDNNNQATVVIKATKCPFSAEVLSDT